VPSLAVESIAASVHSEADIENVIRRVGSEPDSALFVLPDSHNVVHRKRIIELTAQYRLPTIYYFRYFASDGGLISYGPDEMDLFRRTAGYVDRILRGTNPSDLPVQQPTNKSQNCQGNGDTYSSFLARPCRRSHRVNGGMSAFGT
ncbi:MAG: ABC transporter substrate binding protein, partial [Pseudolabrys sp.]